MGKRAGRRAACRTPRAPPARRGPGTTGRTGRARLGVPHLSAPVGRPPSQPRPPAGGRRRLHATTLATGPTGIRPQYRTRWAWVRRDDSLLALTGHTAGVAAVAFGTGA